MIFTSLQLPDLSLFIYAYFCERGNKSIFRITPSVPALIGASFRTVPSPVHPSTHSDPPMAAEPPNPAAA
ncbi:hypothetical protein [Sinosporangium siamense]|uniref:hypothetical protein n=1 Tax=Sinosporangium siamense TaxID=1367973 RepID=UPI00195264AB|nr:hypothetical protein [Sinosporangium siamense]